MSRNERCPCGSGKRRKQCCDDLSSATRGLEALASLKHRALAAQRAGDSESAEQLYRRVLADAPNDADALNMLGVLCLQREDAAQAVGLMYRSLEANGWRHEPFRQNLLLALSDWLRQQAQSAPEIEERHAAFRRWHAMDRAEPSRTPPKISVVVPCYNHSAYVQHALQSVFAQSYRNLELVVIDDGSTDASASVITGVLGQSPFPHRFVSRENRGKSVTANEAIALSQGEWIHMLHADDAFHPQRLERLLQALCRRNADWGFTATRFIDGAGAPWAAGSNGYVDGLSSIVSGLFSAPSNGFPFVRANASISPGNLLVKRSLMTAIGGFRDYRANEDWDFVLRAIWRAEPVFLGEPLFDYRVHGANTFASMPREQIVNEAREITHNYLCAALGSVAPNPFAPCSANWGDLFLAQALMVAGDLLALPRLREILHGGLTGKLAIQLRQALGEALPTHRSAAATAVGQEEIVASAISIGATFSSGSNSAENCCSTNDSV